MKDIIYFRLPQESDRVAVMEYKQEFCGEWVHGSCGLTREEDFDVWLKKTRNEQLAPNKVPTTTFLAMCFQDGCIAGMVNIRHWLDEELLMHGGHIGYSVRPGMRRKGVATEMLRLALLECKKMNIFQVLVTCDKDNYASAKTIINNKGVLENELIIEGKPLQRYWIEIRSPIICRCVMSLTVNKVTL